jgi:hypothetical protein
VKLERGDEMKYDFHSDPGHGWLAVDMLELERLQIASKISGYSYRKDNVAYLEEDCDASLFCDTKERLGEKVEINELNSAFNDSPVRSYRHYFY